VHIKRKPPVCAGLNSCTSTGKHHLGQLLKARTLRLQEFLADRVLPYAILSHTWERDELTYQGIREGLLESNRNMYMKMRKCCEQAIRDGLNWVWVDTCCIDKTSSAELSEAINSMYEWCQSAAVCYAYLSDVDVQSIEIRYFDRRISKSRWFSRGWTLQELIAPQALTFFDQDWTFVGIKESLVNTLSWITGVKRGVLVGKDPPSSCSIAERMSWAADRSTTREEDMAYSLLSVFNINMPLLYGEGERAFFRLQEEIVRHEEDYTVLLWGDLDSRPDAQAGFLARSPADFSSHLTVPYFMKNGFRVYARCMWSNARCIALTQARLREKDVVRLVDPEALLEKFEPPSITSRGLKLKLFCKDVANGELLLWTFCVHADSGKLILIKLDATNTLLWRSPDLLEYCPKEELMDSKPRELDLPIRWREPGRLGGRLELPLLSQVDDETYTIFKITIYGLDTPVVEESRKASEPDPPNRRRTIRLIDTWPSASCIPAHGDYTELVLVNLLQSTCVSAVLRFKYNIGPASAQFAVIIGFHESRFWLRVPRSMGRSMMSSENYFTKWQAVMQNDEVTNQLSNDRVEETRVLQGRNVWISVIAHQARETTSLRVSIDQEHSVSELSLKEEITAIQRY